MIIAGKYCEDCAHCTVLEEQNPLKIYCSEKDKYYYWGQCIPCETKVKKEVNDGED